jgi:hypothetical protein
MTKPLTEAQKTMVAGCAWDTHSHAAIEQALARLDYLERRLAQADDLYQCLLACHSCGCQRPGCSWCRADAAEQLVAELRAVLVRRHAHDVAGGLCDTPERCSCDVIVTATLEASAPVANRWCLASERDAAIARAEKAEAELAQRPEATGL